MSAAIIHETGDHTKAVERIVSLPIGGETHTFSVWCSRYTADHLTRDDWANAGTKLREFVSDTVRRMVLSGDYFTTQGQAVLRQRAERAMRDFIYDAFRAGRIRAGDNAFQVDSLLKGEEYRT